MTTQRENGRYRITAKGMGPSFLFPMSLVIGSIIRRLIIRFRWRHSGAPGPTMGKGKGCVITRLEEYSITKKSSKRFHQAYM
jgi:hypothetical protein